MRAAFFHDSAALKRDWSFDVNSQALSGTDSTVLQVYLYLREAKHDVTLLATRPPSPPREEVQLVKNVLEAYDFCVRHAIEFLVYVINTDAIQYELLTHAAGGTTGLIAWAHNNPDFAWCNRAWECPAFHRLVAVSNFQRLSLTAHPIFTRTVAISNFLEDALCAAPAPAAPANANQVTYVGALKSSKGFHHLAAVWPAVRARFPQALLNVCGSPGLYQSDLVLGAEGIAEVEFEKTILGFLGGSRASAEQLGVHFLGSLPKKALYEKIQASRFVVVNPNMPKDGSTESFCVSAAEALALGVPVVGGAAGGLLEVVGHGKGGLLAGNGTELLAAMSTLLAQPEVAHRLARQGQERVVRLFTKASSMKRWEALLNGEPLPAATPTDVRLKNRAYYFKSMVRLALPLSFLNKVRGVYRKASGLPA